MRISTLPTIHGEKIVARVLNKSTGILSIEQFGFSQQNTEEILRVLRLNQGLILVTGPQEVEKQLLYMVFYNI